jgi:esterase
MSLDPKPESHWLTSNCLKLHYLNWGNPGAPPMVCVHGFTSTAQSFNGLARRVQDRFHVVATDVRGHGESAWSPTGAYQYADQVRDLEQIVDQLGLEQFTLVGTSMGGIIVMAYAGAHPERVQRLVINDIGPDQEPGSNRITGDVSSRPSSFGDVDEAITFAQRMQPFSMGQLNEDEQRELVKSRLRQTVDGRWTWRMDPAYIQQRVALGPPPRPNLWDALPRITCPTLVIWAADSDVLSGQQAQRMVEVLPHGELVAVPGMVHAPTLREPVAVDALDRFLGR